MPLPSLLLLRSGVAAVLIAVVTGGGPYMSASSSSSSSSSSVLFASLNAEQGEFAVGGGWIRKRSSVVCASLSVD